MLKEIRTCTQTKYVINRSHTYMFHILQGSYNCHTVDIPSSLCSEGRYLTILFHKKELGHDGYDFFMELREMTQSKE